MDKHYDYLKCEAETQSFWKKENLYKFETSDKPCYSIDTPPPTVSGSLHIGHIFSYTHTDIIARYKRLVGFNVFYPMGFDDNGLPTEKYVEKKNKTKAHLMKRSEFINLCLKECIEVEESFKSLWEKIALSVDWSNVYTTISERVRKVSQISFIDLYKKDIAYRKMEPSLYCTTCRTSVAQAELEGSEVNTMFNDIEFVSEDGSKFVIATTRPELLPACVAVFYHPNDSRYKKLYGKSFLTPLFNKKVPVLPDELVDQEKGSGLVMCCTFGDQTDILWFKKHNLPFIQVVGRDGTWTEEAGPLQGLRVLEARKKALSLLQEEGKLISQKKILHNVNVHERCKQEIEYFILNQWFINILEHKTDLLALGEKVSWYPTFMKSRYKDWVENLNWDWCISRQRFYGIPFPVWYCQDCKDVIVAEEKDLPIDPQEQEYPGKLCSKCGSEKLIPDTDIMDTWNTSSLTPQINCNWPGKGEISMPMSLRPQAHDIIRTWAFSTIVKSHYHNNSIPWNDIVVSGHVLAGKSKISKSQGNESLTPENLLKNYSADVIRFWAASGKLGTDTAFSENQLKIGQKLITKIWNAFRFFTPHLENYIPQKEPKNLGSLNEWILDSFSKKFNEYIKNFEKYEYSGALEDIDRFFWHFFCDNYLELVKDQFFNPENYDSDFVQNTRYTLYEIGFGILQLYSPFLPHITEYLYQKFYKEHIKEVSINKTELSFDRYKKSFPHSVNVINNLLEIVDKVRKLKSEKQISLKTILNKLVVFINDENVIRDLKEQEKVICGITKANVVDFICKKTTDFSIEEDGDSFIITIGLTSDNDNK